MADEQPKSNAVGPGSVATAQINPPPLLGGADENYYAEILNPLSQDFIGRVASSKPVKANLTIVTNENTPTLTKTEQDIERNYGLSLRNKDHMSNKHFVQTVTIAAGKTLRLQGNEAQVIIRQLVDIIMDRRDQTIFKGDPTARRKVEEEIVLNVGTMDEFLTQRETNVRDALNKDNHNERIPQEEQSFPSETGTPGKTRGRPKGSGRETTPDPAPGRGAYFEKAAV